MPTPTYDDLADALIQGAKDLEDAAGMLQGSCPASAAVFRGQAHKMLELEVKARPYQVAPQAVWSRAKPKLRIVVR